VPRDAEVWIEGKKMKQSGEEREFVTPPLARGYQFEYEIRAKWPESGKEIERSRHIKFQGGDQFTISFMDSASDESPTIVQLPGPPAPTPGQFGGGPYIPGYMPQQQPAAVATNPTMMYPGGVGGIPIFPGINPFNRNLQQNPFLTGIHSPQAQVPFEGTPQTPGTGRTVPPTPGGGTPQTPGTGITTPDLAPSQPGTVQPQGTTGRPTGRPGTVRPSGGRPR